MNINAQEFINLSVSDAAAVLLTEDRLNLKVLLHAGDLATGFEELEDEVRRSEDCEETAVTVGGEAAAAVDGGADGLLDVGVDTDVEGVGSTKHTVDGGGSGGVEPEAGDHTGGDLEVAAAAGLVVLFDLVVFEGLEASPADHPFVGFLLNEFNLVLPAVGGHLFFLFT